MSARPAGRTILIVLALACNGALANPEGPQVVHGSATFTQPAAGTLNVTNSHNAIINWQSFDIDPGQTTNFIQPGSNSAVLNRVMSNDPSKIYGNLNSNGKVFLINQHGLMIGAGAQINTAGFFGSTLDITNEDFLNGNLKFDGGGFGGIQNYGYIHAGPNGNVLLVAPDIENGGVIEVDNGNVILAAGESIRITSLNDAAIEFELQAPDNAILNLGEIIANQGAARLFAGQLKHSGAINATGVVKNADGSISLVAQRDIEVAAGATLTASGDEGGEIRVQSLHGDVYFNGEARARGAGGHGGRIEILGERVGLFGAALADASGGSGGGEVLIGGDFQGKGEVANARQTQVGPDAVIRADALESGDGGKVIVWADETTVFSGTATARGGAQAGDGGFIEISGKGDLGYYGSVDASPVNGEAGTILFDPTDVLIQAGGADTIINPLTFATPGALFTLDPTQITNITNQGAGSDVIIQAERDITINGAITTNATGTGGKLSFQAGQSIFVNANIFTDDATIALTANDTGASAANRGSGEAKLVMAPDTMIDAGAGNIEIEMDFGSAGTAGDITLGTLNAKHVILVHNGQTPGGDILQNTGATITATSLFVNHDFNTGGTVGTAIDPLGIVVDNFGAHIHGATVAPNGIHVKAQPNSGAAVTIGGTCYGAGNAANGCDTFGSHLITGLEMVNGGGDIFLDVTGDLNIADLVQISDPDATGNPGHLQLSASGNISVNNTVQNNIDSLVLIAGGSIDIFSSVVAPAAASSINLDAGTQINLNSAVLDAGGGIIDASNETVVAGFATIKSNMSVANLQIAGSTASLDNSAALQIGNVFDFDGGILTGSGSTTLLNGATLNLNGTVFPMTLDAHTLVLNTGSTASYTATGNSFAMDNGAALVNDGVFNLTQLGITSAGATGTIQNGGQFTVGPTTAAVAPQFVNSGTLEVQAGASLTLPAGLTLGSGSLFVGGGTVVADVTNNGGFVQPGGLNAIDALTISGNYTQTSGQIQIEIQSTGIPGVDYDQLIIGGDANLLGGLSLLAIGGYTVNANDSFTPITYATRLSGNVFGSISPIGLETVTPTYNGTSLDLLLGFGTSMFWDGGAGTSNWNDALNWSLDRVPDATFDVSISAATVNVSSVESVNSLILNGNLNLNINGNLTILGALSVGGALVVNDGSLAVGGVANFDGNFVQNGGNASFTGRAVFNAGYGHANGITVFAGGADFIGPNTHANGVTTFNGATSMAGATTISGGTLIFNAVGTMHNLNNTWSGGTITGTAGPNLVLGVSPGDTRLSITGAAPKILSTITLDMNRNDIVMSGSGSLNFAAATIDNTNGTSFDHSGTGSFLGSGTFDNTNGHLNQLSGSLFIPATINFINTAGSQVNVSGGSLAFEAAVTDPANYNIGSAGLLLFPNGRVLAAGSTLNLQGTLLAGNALTLPGTFNSTGNLVLNNATLNLTNLGGTLNLSNGAALGGAGTVAGNVVNSSGVLVVGGAGSIGDLTISGNYVQGANAAMVVDVFNNGVTTVSDRLIVPGTASLDGLLVIGFTTSSLGLVTADFRPFVFGSASGGFRRVIDAAGNILQLSFAAGEFTILGSSPKVPDSVIEDLIKFADNGEELADEVADNRSDAEAAIDAMLEEQQGGGELVCR